MMLLCFFTASTDADRLPRHLARLGRDDIEHAHALHNLLLTVRHVRSRLARHRDSSACATQHNHREPDSARSGGRCQLRTAGAASSCLPHSPNSVGGQPAIVQRQGQRAGHRQGCFARQAIRSHMRWGSESGIGPTSQSHF